MSKFSSLTNRVLVTIVGIPALIYFVYYGEWLFLLFIAFVLTLATNEYFNLVKYPKGFIRYFQIVVNLSLLYSLYHYRFDMSLIIIFISFLWQMIYLLINKNSDYSVNSGFGLASMLYPGFALAGLVLLRELPLVMNLPYKDGFTLMMLIYLGIWICDSLAYFFGSAFGETKIFPSVSPNKSWEGTIAGILGALVVALIAFKFNVVSFFNLWDYLFLAFVTGVVGQLGDLTESKIKREAGVKDSSNLLPGHGGALDRFDSLAFAAPLFWLYIYIKFVINV